MSRRYRQRWSSYPPTSSLARDGGSFLDWLKPYPKHPLTRTLNDPTERGEWTLALLDGKICIVLCCPLCGELTTLRTTEHSILFHNGGSFTAHPSVKCPKCPWHTFIRESTWEEVPLLVIEEHEKDPKKDLSEKDMFKGHTYWF